MKVIKLLNRNTNETSKDYRCFLFEKDHELFVYIMDYGIHTIEQAQWRLEFYNEGLKNQDNYVPLSSESIDMVLPYDDLLYCQKYQKVYLRELKLKRILDGNN